MVDKGLPASLSSQPTEQGISVCQAPGLLGGSMNPPTHTWEQCSCSTESQSGSSILASPTPGAQPTHFATYYPLYMYLVFEAHRAQVNWKPLSCVCRVIDLGQCPALVSTPILKEVIHFIYSLSFWPSRTFCHFSRAAPSLNSQKAREHFSWDLGQLSSFEF